jgi:hypothetical protein
MGDDNLTTWDVVNWKVALLLVFICMLINSDIFVDNVLSKMGNAVNNDMTTAYGVFLQSLIVGLSYVIFQPLAAYNYI